MLQVQTARLTLLACPAHLARAAYRGRLHLQALLGARVHQDWPTPEIRDFLPIYARQIETAPGLLGWGIWIIVHNADRQVMGDIGFKGRPDATGSVDIGYGIVPAYRRQGYGAEAAAGLRDWAFEQPGVQRLTADCWPHNTASARILEKIGMRQIGASDAGLLLWELRREDYHHFPKEEQLAMTIRRLHHAQITIPRGAEAEARAFYCALLGLGEVEKPASLVGRGGFWLAVGDQQVHVGVEDDVDRRGTKAHLAYQVDDLGAWRARFAAQGIAVAEQPPIPGYDRFEIRDPFGNRIEFIQPLNAPG